MEKIVIGMYCAWEIGKVI